MEVCLLVKTHTDKDTHTHAQKQKTFCITAPYFTYLNS